MKKPAPDAIRAAVPLTRLPTRPADPLAACHVCGVAAKEYTLWLEHDEHDKPLPPRVESCVYLGLDHKACEKALNGHPRLYARVYGLPGTFPRLCALCAFRRGTECSHRLLKANGGPGLRVGLQGFNGFMCGPKGCQSGLRDALDCEGQHLPGEPFKRVK